MEKQFFQELERLRMTALEMAALTQRAVEKAVGALLERDTVRAEEVIAGDRRINLLEVEIDRYGLRLLALDQPFARDLRFIVGCMRTAVDLERIADQGVNIAQRALFLNSRSPLPPSPDVENLAAISIDMLRSAIAAFRDNDSHLARRVCRMDDIADGLNIAVLKGLLDYMAQETPAAEQSVATIITARCLERVADHSTNIAENVVFIVEGINIRHNCQLLPDEEALR